MRDGGRGGCMCFAADRGTEGDPASAAIERIYRQHGEAWLAFLKNDNKFAAQDT